MRLLNVKALRLAVAVADIRGHMDFRNSLSYWHDDDQEPTDEWFSSLQPQTSRLTVTDEYEIVEVTDCHAEITAPHGTSIHVYGDLTGRINVTGQCEVIIAGNVLHGGAIYGDGIVRVYIGGSLYGEVINKGSSRVWIRGDLVGRVGVGQPSCQLHVLGDCIGFIEPVGDPFLLYLEVSGFMPFAAVERTGAVGFTEFNAVVHHSDCDAGFYPYLLAWQQLADHRSYNRWTILANGQPRDISSGTSTADI